MRTEQINIYGYSELNDSAKCRARDYFAIRVEYPWYSEAIASIKAFCEALNVEMNDYRIDPDDYRGSYIRHNADNLTFRGYKVSQAAQLKDKDLTGYCLDYTLTNNFYDNFVESGSALLAFKYALNCAIREIESDIEYTYSKEALEEFILCNEYEFTEQGEIYH